MELDAQVLIVGGGPVGLLGARLLGQRGVSTILVEKYPSRLSIPKAHALNPRSLEICSAAGLPMDALHAAGTRADEGGFVRFMTTLSGLEIGSLPYERQDEAVRALTPWPLINIAQPNFEKVIEQSMPNDIPAQFRNSVEWLGYEETQDGIISTLRPRGTDQTYTVKTRYIIGADGAMSRVRDEAGIALSGEEALAHCITIHFEADLRSIAASRPGILYFLFGVRRGAALIAYDISKTWVLMHRFDPAIKPADSFTQSDYEEAIRNAIGQDCAFEVKAARPWTMSSQVADAYKRGRIFLAGDAAHRFPPTGGLGLNTGLGDIDNLAWKIAATEQGWAGAGLLETYETERQYVAQTNAAQSAGNAIRMRVLTDALGQGARIAANDRRTQNQIEQDLIDIVLDPQSQESIKEGIAQQKQHFDSLRLQLGYIYGEYKDLERDAPIDHYSPKAIVGAYLPHRLLSDGRSILDHVRPDGFTLITGPKFEGGFSPAAANDQTPLTIIREGRDFTVQTRDKASDKTGDGARGWAAEMGLLDTGALLIRPDRHILWRAEKHDAHSAKALRGALASYLDP